MKTKHAIAPLAAFALLLAACTDSATGPSRSLIPATASNAVTLDKINFMGGGSYPAGVDDGDVRLCKTGDAEGTFNFNVTVDGVPQADVQRTLGPGGGTDCGSGPIFTSDENNGLGGFSTVTITEDGQANWALTGIDVIQHVGLGIFNSIGYPAGSLADDDGTTTAGQATVYVNDDMARTVTFTNDFTAPPEPPPVCDFITFGRLELSTEAGVKVVVSGNAGGNNADGSIKNEFHIMIGEKKAAIDYHVADAVTYGPIANAPLQTGPSPLFPNSRMVTGTAKNGMFVELRLWDGGEPGKGTDMVYYRITNPANGNALVATLGPKLIDQGNMQYHANCRGPN